jgi:isoquinoline 1-oxidoreductase beta subunit
MEIHRGIGRRRFLKTAGAAAGFTLCVRMPALAALQGGTPPTFEPSAYLRIAADDTITIWVTRMEMGQGVRTLLPALIAEELEVDLARVTLEQAEPGGKFKNIQLHTSGSGSSSGAYNRLRTAGAAAREMLVAAAAAEWNVDVSTCRAERGTVTHAATNRRRTYGQLAAAASRVPVPAAPKLKAPSQFTLLRHSMPRVDTRAIVRGTAQYGADRVVPGMRYASIVRAPAFGATVVRVDSANALKVAGVLQVLPVSAGIHPGVAVIATNTWSAMRGAAALTVEWTPPTHPFDSSQYLKALPAAVSRASYKVRHDGDASAALAQAAKQVEASYLFPFQAHAPIEPMNCIADVRADRAEFWVPTQTAVRTMAQAVKVTGLPEDRIQIHCTLMGGGFGRRLFADFVAEAAEISKGIGQPVQLTWTRESDMCHGYFQPATGEQFTAGLDAAGQLTALVHKTSSSNLTIYDIHDGRNIWSGPPAAAKAADAYESDQSPWGAYDNPYEIPNLRVDCADVTSPVPVGPWRAVEYPATVFGRESFLDELAHATGRDPIDFRLAILPKNVKKVGSYNIDRARLARVLENVRERTKWSTPVAQVSGGTMGRGVSASVYHAGSYLAMVAEAFVAADLSRYEVRRLTTVVDCGIALNPAGVTAQTESGIAWALTAALMGKINFVNGAAVETNFDSYHVLRMNQMPALDTVILDSGADPGGFGEHPVPLVAPAIANAIFAACGRRLRELPLKLQA